MRRGDALSRLWTDTCRVTVQRPQRDADTNITTQEAHTLLDGAPCRLSFTRLYENAQNGPAAEVSQVVKLILSPHVPVPPGSEICVHRQGVAFDFCASGPPALYACHQEVVLVPKERFA